MNTLPKSDTLKIAAIENEVDLCTLRKKNGKLL